MTKQNQSSSQSSWKPMYTIVLVANLVYILLFWWLTSIYN